VRRCDADDSGKLLTNGWRTGKGKEPAEAVAEHEHRSPDFASNEAQRDEKALVALLIEGLRVRTQRAAATEAL
jgi:hypothetical protein